MQEIGNKSSKTANLYCIKEGCSRNKGTLTNMDPEEAHLAGSDHDLRKGGHETVIVYFDNDNLLSPQDKDRVLELTGVKL